MQIFLSDESAIFKVPMGVGKALFSEFFVDYGLLQVENLVNQTNKLMKGLDQAVVYSMFLSDHIHAWEH